MTRHVKCCTPGCDSRGSHMGTTFHKFPPDDDDWLVRRVHPDGRIDKLRRRKIWEDRLLFGQKALVTYRVCSLHFKSSDFFPKWDGQVQKSNHLKKTALPSCNLPCPKDDEDGGSSEADWKVLETELPDGTVCEFFRSEDGRFDSDDASTSIRSPDSCIADRHSDCEGSVTADADCRHCTGEVVGRRKASADPLAQLDGLKSGKKPQGNQEDAKRSRKVVDIFDVQCIIHALEEETVCLPSLSWSYSLLNRSILMFLCWDEKLELTKKAVLRQGCPLQLFCNGRLLASKSELHIGNYDELQLALLYLDKYEWCQGIDLERRSSKCELYIVNGKSRCSPCHHVKTGLDLDDSFT